MRKGNVVKIDTDNIEWGRVVGDAKIVDVPRSKRKPILVEAFSIRAYILVRRDEIFVKAEGK